MFKTETFIVQDQGDLIRVSRSRFKSGKLQTCFEYMLLIVTFNQVDLRSVSVPARPWSDQLFLREQALVFYWNLARDIIFQDQNRNRIHRFS